MKLLDRTAGAVRNSIRAMLGNWFKPERRVQHYDGSALLEIVRQRAKSGTFETARRLRCGPNHVHAVIFHPDGSLTDIGLSKNLLTNIGRDVLDGWWGYQAAGANATYTANASSSTSIGVATTPFTASALATSVLGLAGLRVWADNGTSAPVWGNVASNTTSTVTVDKWWTWSAGAQAAGTTPSSTAAFTFAAGGLSAAQFIALSTDSGAASATHTTLTSEVTTNGGARVLGTYAHTLGATTLTLSNTFTASGAITGIHKGGILTTISSGLADPLIFETVLNADATLASSDTLALTWTITLSSS